MLRANQRAERMTVPEAQQVAVKLWFAEPGDLQPRAFVDTFHRWIRDRALDEPVLIDVADYAHVHDGPGVLLVCHGAHYAIDERGGRIGLQYARKRDEPGPLHDKVRAALARVLAAAALLEAGTAPRVRFETSRLEVLVVSKLVAPRAADYLHAARPALEEIGRILYAGDPVEVAAASTDDRAPFSAHLSAPSSPTLEQLRARLADAYRI